MKNDRENKKKTTPGAGKIALLLIFLGLLADLENAGVLAIVVVLAPLVIGVTWLIKCGKKERDELKAQDKKIENLLEQVKAHQSAAAGEDASEKRTPYSNENFDLDEYDRRKRLEQLDVFLKNGIIDKEEYRRMKERYEKR